MRVMLVVQVRWLGKKGGICRAIGPVGGNMFRMWRSLGSGLWSRLASPEERG